MFELPDAKRVRRQDLQSDSEDEAPVRDEQQDAELLAKLHARMAGMIDLGSLEQPSPTPKKNAADKTTEEEDAAMGDAAADEPAEPEEFEFRLFSTAPATKIALVDEDERAMEGDGDMVRKRPLSYYVAEEASAAAREEFAAAAVSGEDVLERAKQRWWGMEMPWRVTTIPGKTKKAERGGEDEEAAARRRRPGKKKRIALRMKEREKKKKAEEAAQAKMGKEEALKEKKKRLNRAKKLRKRAKAKEAKAAGGVGGEADDSGNSSDSGDE
ncbi:hypothetical protein GCG54_00001685 [Colletotrichum gloeosporioides]|uniref:Nucleolar protein n=1 Tax=Colletotrichum gloeosporioides TaxID=474922 RepID=A0A8H4CWQ3_COLGL|nr:uncharacterized protein GCG54_00001685 [Colletotrichum gloeosporioides]KAF3811364.1 hypothetical protein GCG54_00001685 [Colletotrichum gloeosporioides]